MTEKIAAIRNTASAASAWAGSRLGATRREISRRNGLARHPQPEGVRQPPLRLLLGEIGTPADEWRERRRLKKQGPPQLTASRSVPVMLLPGFGAHPLRMRHLAKALERAGHRVTDWGLGWNLGPTEDKFARLCGKIRDLAEREGEPVTLIGWSLGGLFAREAAKAVPEAVSAVITMGSPFSGDRHANNAWRAYQWITGQTVDEPPFPCDFPAKPPVPTIALWSARDGVVAPRSARGRAAERDSAVAVRCTHLGFAGHPAVAQELIRQLEKLAASRE